MQNSLRGIGTKCLRKDGMEEGITYNLSNPKLLIKSSGTRLNNFIFTLSHTVGE
jgi:hypothetical protein